MKHGFSLVELSIVLVILGLLTGGILAGQNLIRAAEMRSITTQLSSYMTAAQTFRDKYFAIPGDFKDATKFWGSAGGSGLATDAACDPSTATAPATCNGNGDGQVEDVIVGTNHEPFLFWQQLANAGLIEGSYTGVTGTGSTRDHNIGENAPASRISTIGFSTRTMGDRTSADTFYFEGSYGNVFHVGGESPQLTTERAFSPEENWNIDTKMDDGRPAIGNVRVMKSHTGCHTSTTPATSEYNLTVTSKECSFTFSNAF